MDSRNLRLALQWVDDVLSGEIIQTEGYNKDYIQFEDITPPHLGKIIYMLEMWWPELEFHVSYTKGRIYKD